MVSRIDIGPQGGPFVEIDEDNGDLVIRTPNDKIDIDVSDLRNANVLEASTIEDKDSGTSYDVGDDLGGDVQNPLQQDLDGGGQTIVNLATLLAGNTTTANRRITV